MTTLTHDATGVADAPAVAGWAAGLGFAVLSGDVVRALRRRWPRACSTPAGARARLCRPRPGRRAGARCVPAVLGPARPVGPAARERRRWSPATASSPSPAASSPTSTPSTHMQVGVALLIEYTAPVAVVAWLWLRHGHRPRAADRSPAPRSPRVGLVLVLDLLSGADLSVVGVVWALLARWSGAAVYFMLSAERGQRPAAARPGRRRPGRSARSRCCWPGPWAWSRCASRPAGLVRRHRRSPGGCRSSGWAW